MEASLFELIGAGGDAATVALVYLLTKLNGKIEAQDYRIKLLEKEID